MPKFLNRGAPTTVSGSGGIANRLRSLERQARAAAGQQAVNPNAQPAEAMNQANEMLKTQSRMAMVEAALAGNNAKRSMLGTFLNAEAKADNVANQNTMANSELDQRIQMQNDQREGDWLDKTAKWMTAGTIASGLVSKGMDQFANKDEFGDMALKYDENGNPIGRDMKDYDGIGGRLQDFGGYMEKVITVIPGWGRPQQKRFQEIAAKHKANLAEKSADEQAEVFGALTDTLERLGVGRDLINEMVRIGKISAEEGRTFLSAFDFGGENAAEGYLSGKHGPPSPHTRDTFFADLGDSVQTGESNTGDPYNAFNIGTAGGVPSDYTAEMAYGKDLTKMTVEEVMQEQADGNLFAAGRYQIIPQTLEELLGYSGVKTTDKFDQKTQDKLFEAIISKKRPVAWSYISGTSDGSQRALMDAARDLAKEFASFEDPYTGRSYYAGDNAGNSAHVSADEVMRILQDMRRNYVEVFN